MDISSTNTLKILRPFVTVQHTRWLQGATLIDGYLYFAHDADNVFKLYLALEVRPKGKARFMATQTVMYWLRSDVFGLFDAVKLEATPRRKGTPARVDDLKALSLVQRKALRAAIQSQAASLRAAIESPEYCRFSIKLHCLLPRACDPLDGIVNHYASSGRAARDVELARRVQEKRLTNQNKP